MWAASAARYCPSRAGELPKQNMAKSHQRWDEKLWNSTHRSSDAQTRFPRECKTISKRCADKKVPLNYREAASLAAKLEAVKCLGDTAICEKILNAEPIGVEYFRQVLGLCGETRAVKSTEDLLSFDEKSWTCDGRYCAFT